MILFSTILGIIASLISISDWLKNILQISTLKRDIKKKQSGNVPDYSKEKAKIAQINKSEFFHPRTYAPRILISDFAKFSFDGRLDFGKPTYLIAKFYFFLELLFLLILTSVYGTLSDSVIVVVVFTIIMMFVISVYVVPIVIYIVQALYDGLIWDPKFNYANFYYDCIETYNNKSSSSSFYYVELNDKCGLLDNDLNPFIPLIFDEIDFVNNFIQVRYNNKLGLYNLAGSISLPIRYNKISFNKYHAYGYLVVENEEGVKRVSKHGSRLIPKYEDHIFDNSAH